MQRFQQLLLVATFLAFSWLAMMAVHEFGHVVGAFMTGGTVSKVVLHPLAISRTDLSENPHPLIVAWLGPLVGVALPLVVLAVFKLTKLPGWYLVQFFAGFCLISNGAYMGIGAFGRIGDAGDLLNHGSPIWCLWVFGLIAAPMGLFLWNGLGREFGLGEAWGEVDRGAVYLSCALLVITLILEVTLSPH